MAFVTEPEAIRFAMMMREIKKLLATIDIRLVDNRRIYLDGVNAMFEGRADTDVVAESTLEDGRTPLTVKDVKDMVTQYIFFVTWMDQPGVRDTVRKGIVGTLTIE